MAAKPAASRASKAADKALLRFLTCGSVDDGKSTLIGRLLYESEAILSDQFASLERDSKRFGTTGDDIDFSLLLDGLEDERQQRITIDVAYRFFATKRRSFIVADSPGHEQYTRNMATGASTADLALLLVDARKGVVAQTRRHALICSLLGIRHIVLAINKLDLVGFDRAAFEAIADEFRRATVTMSAAARRACPGITARACSIISKPSISQAPTRAPSFAFRCNGSAGRTATSAASRARSLPGRSLWATGSSSPARASKRRSRRS
jgi:bifunctional enzyme CysN/CysC